MLSRREKLIVWFTVAVLAIFAGDRWLLTPLSDYRQRLDEQRSQLVQRLQTATRLLSRQRQAQRRWRELTAASIPADASTAESNLLHATRSWAREAGLEVSSLQPDRPLGQEELRQVMLNISSSGAMASVTRFLYLLESSELPVRIERFRIAGSEGRDELKLDLKVSTIYHVPAPAGRASTPAVAGRDDRTLASTADGSRP